MSQRGGPLLSNREYGERGWRAAALTAEPVLAPHVDYPGNDSFEPAAAETVGYLGRLWASAAALREAAGLVLLLPLVLLIQGYHPWSDDAAIYIAGLRKMMQPALFPGDAPFVLSHTRVSVFSHVLAGLASAFDLRLVSLVLLSYVLSALLFLYACRRLALRIFDEERASWIATLFAVACFTLPVAGTALFVMDPYLSARSFSTPFSLLAIAAVLERRWTRAGAWILLTGAMHPQMGAYLAGFVTILVLVERRRVRMASALAAVAVLGCGAIWLATLHEPVTAAWREAVLSRKYFFPTMWQWYEWVGLGAPLLLLVLVWVKAGRGTAVRNLASACVLVGSAACVAAFAFVHPQGPYFLARVQLLRSFQLIYVLGLVMLGGMIGRVFSGRLAWVGGALFLAAAGGMYCAQLQMYPGSAHLEWPGVEPVNPWGRALVWIRRNTPQDAKFAISPTLLSSPAEDLPGFRALAERGVLVDNKDEGVASIFPDVAPLWKQRAEAEAGLDRMTPAERAARLAPFGVNWLLLPPAVAQSLPCPYRNAVVAVCRMTDEAAGPPER